MGGRTRKVGEGGEREEILFSLSLASEGRNSERGEPISESEKGKAGEPNDERGEVTRRERR